MLVQKIDLKIQVQLETDHKSDETKELRNSGQNQVLGAAECAALDQERTDKVEINERNIFRTRKVEEAHHNNELFRWQTDYQMRSRNPET